MRLLGEPVQRPFAHLVQRLRERVELDHRAAAVAALHLAPGGLVAHLVDRAAHHLRERRQPELVAEREAVDRQVGRERHAAPALLARVPRSSRRRRSAAIGMPPASIRASDSASSRSWAASSPVRPPSQRTSPSSAARASALRCASDCSSVGQRRDPRVGVERLALDRDAARFALAKALDAVAVDRQLVARAAAGAELDLDLAHVLLAAAEQAAAAALDARAAGQRGLELGGEHLDRDAQVGAVGAQARRGEIEGLVSHRQASLDAGYRADSRRVRVRLGI